MRNFKLKCLFVVTFIITAGTQIAFAEQTVGEKVEVKANNVKREVKKSVHRVEEDLCSRRHRRCNKKIVANRVIELKDATVDGAKELKNAVD